MEFDEFRDDLLNYFKREAIINSEYPIDLFIDYAKDILINDYALLYDLDRTFIDVSPSSSSFRTMKLDASHLETALNTLHLLVADYNDGSIFDINNEFVQKNINYMENFLINVYRGYFNGAADSDPTTQLARSILRNKDDIKKLHLIIVSTNKKSSRMKTTFEIDKLEIGNQVFDVDLSLVDMKNIYETKLATFKKDDLVISTKDFGFDGIPCIKADINTDKYTSYLAIVPGKFLSDIYLKYPSQLLESNVRSFLNTRGEINKGILNTILYDKSNFFAYNNGISTTADEIEVVTTPNGLAITSFKNLQIINGGQTTASLANAVLKNEADLTGIFVQMKLSIIPNNDERPELIRLIAKYANKQNKVTNADLNSNHPFFIRIEEFSRKIKAPLLANTSFQSIWFFERARGQYDQLKMKLSTKKEREIFELQYPKAQKFTKTDIAKYLNSARQRPFDVSWGAEVNLTKCQADIEKAWDKNNTIFNESFYKDLIAKAIIFKTIETIISNEDWYLANRGYRAQLVTYTFSKFISEIKKTGKCFNYKKVWELQKMPDVYENDLKRIAYLCYEVFNNPQRQVLNIGEYAKKEMCWKIVDEIKFSLSNETISNLVDKEDLEVENKAAKSDQKLTNEISNEITIFNMGIPYWKKVIEIGKQLNELNYYELSLCEIAIKYIQQVIRTLNKKQVSDLGKIISKMEKYIN